MMMADLFSRRPFTSLLKVVAVSVVFGGGLMTVPTAEAALKHQYTFNTDVAALGTFADSAPGGTVSGTLFNNATVSAGALNLPGAGTGFAAATDHAELNGPALAINTYHSATFSLWATQTYNSIWQRYFDIGGQNTAANSANNSIWVTPNANNANIRVAISNTLLPTDVGGGFEQQLNPNPTRPPVVGQLRSIIVTFDGTADIGRVYVDGQLMAQNFAMTHQLENLQATNALIGASLYNGDFAYSGTMTNFEIYDNAMTPTEALNAYYAGPVGEAAPQRTRLDIDRATGTMTLVRNGADSNIVGYSITSGNGGLVSANWKNIANNYDASSGGAVDPNDNWTILSAAGSKTEFAEFELNIAGDGGTLSSATPILIGDVGAWKKSVYEDVQGTIKLANGTNELMLVHYVGNGDLSFRRSDLNFDGSINTADYSIFLANMYTTLTPTLTNAESYVFGDLNGDKVVNLADFRLFKADFLAANPGLGSGALGNVPEPQTVGLMLLAIVGCFGFARRVRRSAAHASAAPLRSMSLSPAWARCGTALVAALTLLAILQANANAAIRNRYSFNNAAGAAPEATVITDSAGAGSGVVLGTGATFTGTGLLLSGGANGSGAPYVDLPNGLISSLPGDASFEAWYTQTSSAGAWPRIFDFGDTVNGTTYFEVTSATAAAGGAGGDTFFWSPMRGNTVSTQRFSFENDNAVGGGVTSGGNNTIDTGAATPLNVQHHVVVTYKHDDDGVGGNPFSRETVFVNGAQVGTVLNTAANDFHLANLNDVNNWLGRSGYGSDFNFQGSFNEFRIYDNLLDANQVAKDFLLGPELSGEILTIDVNKVTGNVTVKNNQAIPFVIDNYRISSAGSQLNPTNGTGWNSLADQDGGPVGTGWDEIGNSNTAQLSELYIGSAGFTVPANATISLGNAYNPAIAGVGNNGDLVFQFGGLSGYSVTGAVNYVVPPAVAGDYNHDGTVNAADYTVYRNRKAGIGGTTLDANVEGGITPGLVTIEDYNFWKSRYGATSGAGSGSAVPEPASLGILLVGLMLVGGLTGRRQMRG